MDKKILIITSSEGHLSLAHASQDYLSKSFKTKIASYEIDQSFKVYQTFYLYFPSLFKFPYKLSEKNKLINISLKIIEKALLGKISKEINHYRPDLIINTYGAYTPTIKKTTHVKENKTPIINVMPDPRTISSFYFVSNKNNTNLYYQIPKEKIKKFAMNPKKQIEISWLVRKKYYQKHDKNKVLKHFGFNEETLTFLICGGSEGTNAILKIIPALLLTQRPLQVIVVCGKNKGLYKRLKTLNNAYQKFCQSNKKIINKIKVNRRAKLKLLRFEKNLAPLIQVSDLVIGKAGPNLLFETIACQKPFMAIAHISGQEDGNLEIIEKKGLGFVEESPIKTIRLLQKIIQNPQILKNLEDSIKKEFQYNKQAGEKLNKIVVKALKTHSE